MSQRYDALIVGRGLAGAVLSEELEQRGKKILVVDERGKGSSSQVAAGLFNPVVLRRHLLSWKASEVLPVALNFYHDLERRYARPLVVEKELAKLFTSEQEAELWQQRMEDPLQRRYMSMGKGRIEPLKGQFGYGIVHGAGWLRVREFLDDHRSRWMDKRRLIETRSAPAEFKLQENGIAWQGHEADRLILCQGSRVTEDPWFGEQGFSLVKGEVLDLRIEGLNIERIISKGFFLMPLGQGRFKAGSTFAWDYSDDAPTNGGRERILQKVRSVLPDGTMIEVLEHQAGIRPASKDRRPVLGTHPDHPQIAIFNGLGARGVMYAPWCAKQLAGHLLDEKVLDKEVDVSRFTGRSI